MTAYLDEMALKAHSLIPEQLTPAARDYLSRPISHVANLPWPFNEDTDSYRYSVNVDPARVRRETRAGAWGEHLVDLGGAEYPIIMAERRHVLDSDPDRVRVRRGMELACWDLLIYYLRDLSRSYPALLHLDEDGDRFHWRNDLLGTDRRFTVGDDATLPGGPLMFLAGEVPDDLILMIERDGHMYFDAGAVTFAAGWAATFDIGMDMHEIHGPVPRMNATGITARAEHFLRTIPADRAYRRINWSFANSPTRTFDISMERMSEWSADRARGLREHGVSQMQFRIEVEHFVRLPMTGAVTFNIRSHMASLQELRAVPAWAHQLAAVLAELPHDLADYKDFTDCRAEMIDYLRG